MLSINNAILSTLVLCLSVASIVCLPFGNSHIFGGKEGVNGQFPYQAKLHTYGNYYCGASIISEKFVLTAGHCIKESSVVSAEDFQVYVGAHNRTDGQIYEVKNVFVHEDFNSADGWRLIAMDNDIALIEVKIPIEFSENVAPIPLNREFIPGDVRVLMSGYGDTETSEYEANLNYLYMTTMSTCEPAPVESNTTLCAISDREGEGTCLGDSGGPLAYNNTLVGIISWSPGHCESHLPSGYTRLSLFIDWIEKKMQDAVQN